MQSGDRLKVIFSGILPGNTIGPSLDEGDIHTIRQVHVCRCGEQHFDIGLESKHNSITCYKCREELPDGDVHHWCHSSRFELA